MPSYTQLPDVDNGIIFQIQLVHPWNRPVFRPVSIYLENGMYAGLFRGFKNPESYVPSTLWSDAVWQPINGTLYMNLAPEVVSGDCHILKAGEVLTNTELVWQGEESIAIGCAEKVSTFTMIDGRVGGQTCNYEYLDITPDYLLNPVNPLTTISPGVAAGDALYGSGSVRRGGIIGGCREHDLDPEVYASETGDEIYCEGLMLKKWTQAVVPASNFCGKLRLYIQCIYGSNEVEYSLQNDMTGSPFLSIGDDVPVYYYDPKIPKPVLGGKERLKTLSRGQHMLATVGRHHFLLTGRNSFQINYLYPTGPGRYLQEWMEENGSEPNLDELEAYLLVSSKPTKDIPGNAAAGGADGWSLDWGWNANWNGTQAVRVLLSRNRATGRRVSTVAHLTIDYTANIADILADEYTRKYNAKKAQQKGDTEGFSGMLRWYSTEAYLINIDTPDECVVGDLTEGQWIWIGDDVTVTLQEVQEKNNDEGMLPLSQECMEELAAGFNFNITKVSGGEFIEPLQKDKICTYAPAMGLYYWHMPYHPRAAYTTGKERSPDPPVDGLFPIYAWYNNDDVIQYVRYFHRSANPGDLDNTPPEGICGNGSDFYHAETLTGQPTVSGFTCGTGTVGNSYHGGSAISTGTQTVNGQVWEGYWSGACGGVGIPCDVPHAPSPSNGIPKFWTHWREKAHGTANTIIKTGADADRFVYTAAVIPRSDCEAAWLLHRTTLTATFQVNTSVDKVVVACKTAPIENDEACWGQRRKGDEAKGWLTCGGLYFSVVWGSIDPEGTDKGIEHFGQNNSTEIRGHPEIASKRWGPSCGETVASTRVYPAAEENLSSETTSEYESTFTGKAVYVAKSGKSITPVTGQGTVDSILTGSTWPLNGFTKNLPLRFPYVVSGWVDSYGVAVQDIAVIDAMGLEVPRYPDDWSQYPPGYNKPVGYV